LRIRRWGVGGSLRASSEREGERERAIESEKERERGRERASDRERGASLGAADAGLEGVGREHQ